VAGKGDRRGEMRDVLNEVQALLFRSDIVKSFWLHNYKKEATIRTGGYKFPDIAMKDLPTIIISDTTLVNRENKRYLFNENEMMLTITCGFLQNDIEKAENHIISLKDRIRIAIRNSPYFNRKDCYSVIVDAKKNKASVIPIYFIDYRLYINKGDLK
jgi:hypothetical protein